MATHDYIISNASGAAVRADLNNALAAIATNNSSATEPTTTYAYQWWADTGSSPTVMKLRNAANSAWITLFQLDGEWSNIAFENGTAAAPSIYFKDSGTDTGIYSPGTDQLGITTGGTVRLTTTTTGITSALPVDVPIGTASAPTVTFTGDLNSGIYSPGADQVAITTNGVERVEWGTSEVVFNDDGANYDFRIEGDTNSSLFFVDASAEAVGIGVTDPGSWNANYNGPMAVIGSTSNSACGLVLLTSSTGNSRLDFSQGSGAFGQARGSIVYNHSNDSVAFSTDNTERARIDSSGRLLVGTSSTSRSDRLQVRDANRTLSSGNGNFAVFTSDTQAADVGAKIILGGQSTEADWLYGSISGKSENNSYAGYLAFGTSASNGVHAERIRIDSGGNINIAKTTANLATTGHTFTSNGLAEHVRSGGNALNVNRLASDGALVEFFQDSTLEGSISVSGTTVSYNGAHLSRWSQLPGGTTREEILRGTVLSNIDEMCAWGEEENEQLNRIKVSDVEGDPNVAGVFQAWDDDDGTYTDDFYCAMTGDFIIRIAEGVTVQRGDLLMSAGDGTAKPQDDDIIRSKTVAKVTSTHVTCTYEDGSYCVPCVLMAC